MHFTCVVVCCLPTPSTLANGGGLISSRLWSIRQLLRPSDKQSSHSGGLSLNPGLTIWYVCGCSSRYDVCSVCECYILVHSGGGCDLTLTLCMYDLRKGV